MREGAGEHGPQKLTRQPYDERCLGRHTGQYTGQDKGNHKSSVTIA